MLAILIALLSAVGLVIATYFTAVAYRWVQPDVWWVPSFCQLGEESCAAIVFTPRARLFGVPNSLLGQLYYLSLLAAAGGGLLEQALWLHVLLGASSLTVLTGAYLTYSLLFLTRVNCRLCFTSHAINLALFVLLLGREAA